MTSLACPVFRFNIVLFDAANPIVSPVTAQVWDNAAGVLMRCSARDFHALSEADQMGRVELVFKKIPKLHVSLSVKQFELRANQLCFIHEYQQILILNPIVAQTPRTPPVQCRAKNSAESSSSKTPKSKSAKAILADLVAALQGAELSD